MVKEWKNGPKPQTKKAGLLSTSYMGRNTAACSWLIRGDGLEVSRFPNDAGSTKAQACVGKQLPYKIRS